MPKLPETEDPEAGPKDIYRYNFEKASQILSAMDYLRREAVKTNIPEIVSMIDATFQIMLTSYYTIRRYEMEKLSGTDFVQ